MNNMAKIIRAAPPKQQQPLSKKYNLIIAEKTGNIKPNKMTQCDRIVRHMRDYGSITSLEAMREYGIMRLASRISDLRKRGYDIDVIMESSKNRYGESTSYARYSLHEEDKDNV